MTRKSTVDFIKSAVVMGSLFGLAMGLVFTAMFGRDAGIVTSLACGTLFGIAMAAFVAAQSHRLKSADGIFENEKVVVEVGANHFRGLESRGGMITLTSTRLIFRSHGKNFHNESVVIMLKGVERLLKVNTLGIVPNGIKVILKGGKQERFVVQNRKLLMGQVKLYLNGS